MSSLPNPTNSPEIEPDIGFREWEQLAARDPGQDPYGEVYPDERVLEGFCRSFLPEPDAASPVVELPTLVRGLDKLSPPHFAHLIDLLDHVLPGQRDPSRITVAVGGSRLPLQVAGELIKGRALDSRVDDQLSRQLEPWLEKWRTKYNQGFIQTEVIRGKKLEARLAGSGRRLLEWIREFETFRSPFVRSREGQPLRKKALDEFVEATKQEMMVEVDAFREVMARTERVEKLKEAGVSADLPEDPSEIFRSILDNDSARPERISALEARLAELEQTIPAELATGLLKLLEKSNPDNQSVFSRAAEIATKQIQALQATRQILEAGPPQLFSSRITEFLRQHHESRNESGNSAQPWAGKNRPSGEERHLGDEWPDFETAEVIFQVAGLGPSIQDGQRHLLREAVEQMSQAIWISIVERKLPKNQSTAFYPDSGLGKVSERIHSLINASIYCYLTQSSSRGEPPVAETKIPA